MKIYIKQTNRHSIKKKLVNEIFAAVAEGKKQLNFLSASNEHEYIKELFEKSTKTIRLNLTQDKRIYLYKGLVIELFLIDKAV